MDDYLGLYCAIFINLHKELPKFNSSLLLFRQFRILLLGHYTRTKIFVRS